MSDGSFMRSSTTRKIQLLLAFAALANITAIMVTSTDSSVQYGTPEQFKATATANGQQVDVTNSVTWTTNPSPITDVSIDSSSGLLTTTSGPTTSVTFFVIATDPASGISGQESFTVHP